MSNRVSIEVPGLSHDNPIPAACRIGPFLVSSVISGKDPQTGRVPAGIEAQCANIFAHIHTLLEIAGATPDQVLKLTVWLKDRSHRAHVNKHWLDMFPDPHSRPARHPFAAPELAEPILMQCELMAVLE